MAQGMKIMPNSDSQMKSKKRIGELLVEMGFITEVHLQKAILQAREKNIKLGEALFDMGVLDRDRLYWVLGNQLEMNYLFLLPDMIDGDLIRRFPIDALEKFQCLPLYETDAEIDFAVADPTNPDITRGIEDLTPEKQTRFHLALPEMIRTILKYYMEKGKGEIITDGRLKGVRQIPKIATPSDLESSWNDFLNILEALEPPDSCYLFQDLSGCRLWIRKGDHISYKGGISSEIVPLFFERLSMMQDIALTQYGIRLVSLEPHIGKSFFIKMHEFNCLGKKLLKMNLIPRFSLEDFMHTHPAMEALLENLEKLIRENKRLLVGGKDKIFIGKCFYALSRRINFSPEDPPPLFIEQTVSTYYPDAMQMECSFVPESGFSKTIGAFPSSLVFFETQIQPRDFDFADESDLFPSPQCKRFIIYSPMAMPEDLKGCRAPGGKWGKVNFLPIYIQDYQVLTF